jgi:hypothetical protein
VVKAMGIDPDHFSGDEGEDRAWRADRSSLEMPTLSSLLRSAQASPVVDIDPRLRLSFFRHGEYRFRSSGREYAQRGKQFLILQILGVYQTYNRGGANMKIQNSIEIAVQPEEVWPFLVVPESIMKWCITFKKCEYAAEQHSGEGMSFYVEEKAGGPLLKLSFIVTEWIENRKVTLKMTSGNFVKGYEQRLTIETIPSGCRLTYMEDIKFPYGIIGKLLGFVARSTSEAHLKEMLAKLKRLAESR